jgi:tetratricopeptide (TPR) repeat protein/transcriptional regulator with XRE-family HTH domain
MKKAKHAVPNQRLKEARELRGWSQKYVAEQISADHYYLSRWERGTASPSPYYRSKLCALFGLDARALGLVHDAPGQREESQEASETPAPAEAGMMPAVAQDSAIPPRLSPAEDLIGRDHLLPQVRAYLSADGVPGLVALYGLPGVGKTTLAVALAHDQTMQDHFHDGTLWAGLGPRPDIPGLLNRWGALLDVPESESQKLRTTEAWIRRLRAAIGARQMLLIIDDAWEIEQALAFKVGGPRCAYLVTTRFPRLALQFAGNGATQVRELSDQDSVRLLARLAPQVVTDEPRIAQSLAQSVGGLPLALTLIGNYLRLQSFSGQPRRLHAAIDRLRSGKERLRLTGPQSLLERSPGLPEGLLISLEAVIEVSEQQLPARAREALRALSIFPAKPNSFSEEAAIAVSQAPAETLDILSDTGLLESQGPGRYTLHQTIADYARAHLRDPAVPARLADYFAAFVEEHERDYDLLSQELPNLLAALATASTSQQQTSFVRCVNAFSHFIFTRGLHTQEAGRYIAQAVEAARSLNDDTLLAAALLHQGRASYKQGHYAQAESYIQEARERASRVDHPRLLSQILMMLGELARYHVSHVLAATYFQESLTLARQINDLELMSIALAHLGGVFSDQGRYADAEASWKEALAIARRTGNRREMARPLSNLCTISFLQGAYAQGEAYGQEALALARDIGYLDIISNVLTNLGDAALEQREYAKAEAYAVEALALARQIGDARNIGANLGSLGQVAARQERYQEAAEYLNEALKVARQVEDIWLLSAMLAERGELYIRQQRFDEAFAVFQEALTVSGPGDQTLVAWARYGLARVAAAHGDQATALHLGKESLTLFEAMGNRQTDEVKSWLQTIPGEG